MTSTSKVPMHAAIHAVRQHGRSLLNDPNVLAVAVGNKLTGGKDTGDLAVTLFVARKVPSAKLPSSARLPSRLTVPTGDVPTDIVEGGPFYPQTNISNELPAHPGTSIGEVSITAGTFGALVYTNADGAPRILSNNHVLADGNRAPLGSPIVYPGPHDGGSNPANTIATLSRFIKLIPENEGTNQVDAALAMPKDRSALDNTPLNGVPAPSKANPAVGLLVGGDGSTQSIYSPIDTVLQLLDVRFASSDCTVAPSKGLQVQKTGRTTEKTTGKITHLNAIVKLRYDGIGMVVLTDQFLTTAMSQGGDSGSVAVTL